MINVTRSPTYLRFSRGFARLVVQSGRQRTKDSLALTCTVSVQRDHGDLCEDVNAMGTVCVCVCFWESELFVLVSDEHRMHRYQSTTRSVLIR